MEDPGKFWARVSVSNGCWLWTGPVDSRGYGHLAWQGKNARAHRVAFELDHGQIPKGAGHHGNVVMHVCDNKLCCKPEHLVLGTQADNMADMKAKGRRKLINAGAKNGRAKLTPGQVQAIRADNRGKRTIAPEYGISPAQVQRVRLGKQWAD
jgi:hypothetical protein